MTFALPRSGLLDGDPSSTYCWLTFLSLASIQTSVVQSIGSALISAEPAELQPLATEEPEKAR